MSDLPMQGEAEKIALDHLVEPLWPVVREQVVPAPFYHSEEAWRHITSAILASPALLTELQAAELRGFHRGLEEAAGIAESFPEKTEEPYVEPARLPDPDDDDDLGRPEIHGSIIRFTKPAAIAQAIRQRMEKKS